MPLLPFKLFKAETRLIVHKKCLYKLKLTYKPDISSSKTLLNQKDEINAELTQVIRAVFFLINAKKNIPQKILTQFFTISVTVKFWKIAQKLGFSKNGSRLKCGHLIELALEQKESRIQETNTEPILVNNDVENENLQNLGYLGLRQFVINSDETDSQSCSSSDDITKDNSPENSRLNANEDNGAFPTDIDGQEVNLAKSIRHQNYLHNQANPSIQTPLTSDLTVQTVSLSAQALTERPHLSAPLNETPASVQALPALISSCTQTDFEEMDLTADVPELNSKDEADYRVPSDHDYAKSLLPLASQAENSLSELEVSNSNKESAKLQENQASDQRLSAADIKSSLPENKDNKDNGVSVDDDGCSVKGGEDDDDGVIKSSCIKEISNPTESTKDADKVEILNSEPENNCLCSSSNNSDSGARNDVWGIGSRTLEVRSKVETVVRSQSDNNRDRPEKTSDLHTEKSSEAHQSSELAIQDGNSSNIEKSESSPEKSENSSSKKRPKPKDKKPGSDSINILRLKSLRSHNKVETILDQKPRTVKKPRNSSQRQRSVPQRKKTPSDGNIRIQRQKQESKMQEVVPTDISFGLHDRYQVQTQELQEDLKLQDLAHPSSSDTKRKRRSLFEYINFSYFLRRAKIPK